MGHVLVVLLGVRAQSRPASTRARFNPPPSILPSGIPPASGTHEPATQAFTFGPKKDRCHCCRRFWKNSFKYRDSFIVTDLAGRTGTRREASGCIHLGQVLYGAGLGDPYLRAKIDLDYAFKISRDIQGLAAVSFLTPRFTDPLRAKRNHEEPSGAVIRNLDPRPMTATDFAENMCTNSEV